MNIACTDLAILNVKGALHAHNENLMTKYKELKKASTDNAYLLDIVKDYAALLLNIKKQKQKQHDGLKKISDYIDHIAQDTNTTEQMLRQTKYDQKNLMNEMNRLRKEIDKLVVDKEDISENE